MSELSKRAAKYYFVQGIKQFLFVIGFIAMMIVFNCLLFDQGSETEVFMDGVGMALFTGRLMVIALNFMFSVYGPNWYDSMALSLGCRRKDIFIGEMIKQAVFVLCNMILLISLATVTKQRHSWILVVSGIFAFVVGPLGLVVGHKVKKIGMMVIVILMLVTAFLGQCVVNMIGPKLDVFLAEGHSCIGLVIGFIIVAAVLFTIFEYWAYKLNKNSMVCV